MSSSRKSSTNFPEPEWILDEGSGQYYIVYTDENGVRQTQWANELETPRTDTAHTEPWYEADPTDEDYLDDGTPGYTYAASQGYPVSEEAAAAYEEDATGQDIAAAVETLALDEAEETESHPHHRESHPATGSSSKSKASEKKSSRRDEKKPSSSKTKKEGKGGSDKKGKGKGKEKETRSQDEPLEPFYEQKQQAQQQAQQQQHRAHRSKRSHGHQAAPTGGTGGATQDDTQPVDAGYGATSAGSVDSDIPYYEPAGGQDARGAYYEEEIPQDQIEVPDEVNDPDIPTDAGYASGFLPEVDDESNDDALSRAMTASRKAYEGSVSYDESHPGYTQPEASYAREADYEPLQEEEDDGSVTPTMDHPRLEPDMIIRGTQGKYEDLDARYCVESSHKFQPGEVFKILWSEPQGQSTRHNSTSRVNLETYTEKIQLENDWGEPFYVGFRRFIVVANDEGHCTCIPILTYIRQGCKKKGAKPAKHGIIHEFGTKPRPLEGEPPLGFKPIRLEIKAAGERLARESRVNYSKLVTVEHNVKVFFIGNIQPDDFDNVVPHAVDTCWQGKIRKRVKKGLANVPRH